MSVSSTETSSSTGVVPAAFSRWRDIFATWATALPYLAAARSRTASSKATFRCSTVNAWPRKRLRSDASVSASSAHGSAATFARSVARSAVSAPESTCSPGSIVNSEKPTARQASMSAVVFRWSASAPVPSVQPSANMPHVASSMTSVGVRPVRVISRIDCCGKIGAIAEKPPTARTARTWPGVARPRRSPRPAEVFVPSGRGRSQSSWRRSPAAFLGERGPTRTVPVAVPVTSPSNPSSTREAPAGAEITSREPSSCRARAHSAPPALTRDAATRSRFSTLFPSLTVILLVGTRTEVARLPGERLA